MSLCAVSKAFSAWAKSGESPGGRHIYQRKAPVEFPADENDQIVVCSVTD